MNDPTRSTARLVAVVLLGVTAAGTGGFAIVAPMIGAAGAATVGPSLGAVAVVVGVAMGVVSLAFAIGAAVAARAVHAGRRSGTPVGMVVGAVLILAPTVAATSGGWHPALSVSYLLGGAILASLTMALGATSQPASKVAIEVEAAA